MSTSLNDLISSIITDVPPVEERISLIHEVLKDVAELPDVEINPNLDEALSSDWATDEAVNDENFMRGILKSFKETEKDQWDELLKTCTANQEDVLQSFIDGKSIGEIYGKFDFGSTRGTREELQELENGEVARLDPWLPPTNPTPSTVASENDSGKHLSFMVKKPEWKFGLYSDAKMENKIDVRANVKFANWGKSFENIPDYTCVVETIYGMQEVVKWAKSRKMSVRVSGYRHSWSPSFARDDKSILISTLNLKTATEIPNLASLNAVSWWFSTPETELNKIELIKSFENDKKQKKAWVRVGCATTNEQLRAWSIQNKQWTLPLNVIMVEITFGGSNAPICHGAGLRHRTLSDLVREIEYVDANGQIHTITPEDKEFLLAASGCFGLIGIITRLTLELDSMTYAVMKPVKVGLVDAIPPPPKLRDPSIRSKLPDTIQKWLSDRTEAQFQKAQEEFERRASNDYYAEWFWFPYSDKVWVHTWDRVNDSTGAENYPSKPEIVSQWIQAIAMEAIQSVGGIGILKRLAPMMRTTTISRMGMASLPAGKAIKTYLPDALHFRRAIQNTRVRDLEIEIPLPPKADDDTKPDFLIVQQAWWDAILKVYDNSKTCPMRMPLEMRIMGGSDILMAPQFGNRLGTCAIEVLTLESCNDIWPAFAQEVLDEWMKLRNFNGHKLNIRPHWAKEWYNLKVDKQDFVLYLKNEAYKEQIPKFNEILESIGKKHGWTRTDVKERFSNKMLDEIFFQDML